MTPKEKAEEIYKKYHRHSVLDGYLTKQCAITHVNGILSLLTEINFGLKYLQLRDYYLEVKEEINKL